MVGKDFLYFLMSADGRFYYEQNGSLGISTVPRPLYYTPDGWLDIEIQRQRSAEFFGLERSFTVPLNFVKDGAFILKHFFYKKGIDETIYLAIADKRLFIDETHYSYYYSLLYKGEIDLSQFEHDGPKVTLNIMEGGPAKMLKANKNTRYEIAMDGDISVKMDGMFLTYNFQFSTFDSIYFAQQSGNGTAHRQYLTTFYKTSVEGQLLNITTQDILKEIDLSIDYPTDTRWFAQAISTTQLECVFRFKATLTKSFSSSSGEYKMFLVKSDGSVLYTFLNHTQSGVSSYNQTFDIEQPLTLNLLADEKLFLVTSVRVTGLSSGLHSASITLSEMKSDFTYKSRYSTTYISALPLLSLFKRLATKAGIAEVGSDLLTQHSDLVATSGDAVRGIDGAVIKTSLSDFYTSLNAILSVGMGIVDGVLRLESKSFWVNYSSPINLGECKGLTVVPAKDYLYNTLKIGYPDKSNEDPNGKYEVCDTHIYSIPNTRVTKELNLTSVYQPGPYIIENIRINFEGKKTTDSTSDNEVFLLHVKDNPIEVDDLFYAYELDRTLNAYATGIAEPDTIFNLFFTPKQCFYRNKAFIKSCIYLTEDGVIKRQSSDKNSDLVVAVPGQQVVAEKADVPISTLGERLFTPLSLEFDNKVPADILELFKANPFRSYHFTNDGAAYVGLPVKDSVKHASNQAQSFTLLSAPSNDLTKLIAYDG